MVPSHLFIECFTYLMVLCVVSIAITMFMTVPDNAHSVRDVGIKGYLHRTVMAAMSGFKPKNDKWIVVNPPQFRTQQVDALTDVHGWSVIVVTYKPVPKGWRPPRNVFVVGAENMIRWGLHKPPTHPSRSQHDSQVTTNSEELDIPSRAWRKRCGVLYALENGAKYVYVTDDVSRKSIKASLTKFYLHHNKSILMADRRNMFNQYGHFGQRSIVPKGLFHDAFHDKELNYLYRLLYNWRPPVIQDIVGYNLDSSRGQRSKGQSIPSFDPSAPPVLVGTGTMAVYTGQNTLYAYNAMWAVITLTTRNPEVSNEWTSLWVQRLLWEIGENVAFFPPAKQTTPRDEKGINQFVLNKKETRIVICKETNRLMDHLRAWACNINNSFYQCVNDLNNYLFRHGFWLPNDIDATQQWLGYLKELKYTEPKRYVVINPSPHSKKTVNTSNKDISSLYGLSPEESSPVKFVSLYEYDLSKKAYNLSHHCKMLNKVCPNLTKTLDFKNITSSAISKPKTMNFFSDILLLIVFNHPHYDAVKYLEETYRPFFNNIVYCGESMDEFKKVTQMAYPFLTYLNVNIHQGLFGPRCMGRVLEMGYDVSGYLLKGDDVLLNQWNLLYYNKNKVWRDHSWTIFNENKSREYWWPTKFGKVPYGHVFTELSTKEASSPHVIPHKEFVARFHRNTRTGLVKGISDTFYIPSRLKASAAHYLRLFFKHGLFLEFTCPFVLRGLADEEDIVDMTVTNLWGKKRSDFERYYKSKEDGFHPLKLSTDRAKTFYCDTYLKDLLSMTI